jgi:hypothetical protein
MRRDEWRMLCFEIAKEHPEYLKDTFEAFSLGVAKQAEYNREKVADMGASLTLLYENAKDEKNRALARKRLIESGLFGGTPFEKKLKKEDEAGVKKGEAR